MLTDGACTVGLFLVHPGCRRFGLGRSVARALFEALAADGRTEVVVSIAEGWQPGLKLLEALGFTQEVPGGAAHAKRNPGPGERPTIRARLRIATRWRPMRHSPVRPAPGRPARRAVRKPWPS